MGRAAATAALLLLACGDDDGTDPPPPPLPDAGCAEPGVPADQPTLSCPPTRTLGCIPAAGIDFTADTSAASCDGSEITVSCTERVMPGDTTASCTATSSSGASDDCEINLEYTVEGAPMIACPDDVSAACEGPRTSVELGDATAMASCDGDPIDPPTSDAPADFPVGDTAVEYTSGALSCTATVTVVDDAAPSLECPSQRIVRLAPEDVAVPESPTVSDTCDDDVALVFDDAPLDRGAYALDASASDDAGNEASCTVDVTVLDLFPAEGLRLLSAELRGDGGTDLTLGWERSPGADVSDVRLERSASADGPWEELGTFRNRARPHTYSDNDAPTPAYYRVVSLADLEGDVVEGASTSPMRALGVTDDSYQLEDQSVAGVPFDTTLYGVVRHPTNLEDGPYPLVVFLHGNHGNCRPADGEDQCETRQVHECQDGRFTTTPNAEGYVYLQETLASLGYVTVSLSANALNCRDDFIRERTALILEHLRRWLVWSESGGAPFGDTFVDAVDMRRVNLVGHSRGGDAVANVPGALEDTPIAGVELASIFGIGSTDFHDAAPLGVPFAILLPACDGDVATLVGARHYDRGLAPADGEVKSQVLFLGANHNYFNTEWRFDDNDRGTVTCNDDQQVGAPAQRGMLEVVLADWIQSNDAETALPPYLRADGAPSPLLDAWAGAELELRNSYASAERFVIDDFSAGGFPDVNTLGEANRFEGMIATLDCSGGCARNFPHVVDALRPAWQDETAACTFETGGIDASGWEALSMRFASRIATINNGLEEHDFAIRVRDAAGVTAEVPLSAHGRLAHRYPARLEREILATVRVPLGAFEEAAPDLDLESLVEVELGMPIASGNPAGSIWMSDLELSAR